MRHGSFSTTGEDGVPTRSPRNDLWLTRELAKNLNVEKENATNNAEKKGENYF